MCVCVEGGGAHTCIHMCVILSTTNVCAVYLFVDDHFCKVCLVMEQSVFHSPKYKHCPVESPPVFVYFWTEVYALADTNTHVVYCFFLFTNLLLEKCHLGRPRLRLHRHTC